MKWILNIFWKKRDQISKSEYSIYNNKTKFDKYDWIIDGIFGIGLSRSIEPPYLDIIYKINENKNIISIDIPSGVYANGRGNTHHYIKPCFTLALGYVKIGLFDLILILARIFFVFVSAKNSALGT